MLRHELPASVVLFAGHGCKGRKWAQHLKCEPLSDVRCSEVGRQATTAMFFHNTKDYGWRLRGQKQSSAHHQYQPSRHGYVRRPPRPEDAKELRAGFCARNRPTPCLTSDEVTYELALRRELASYFKTPHAALPGRPENRRGVRMQEAPIIHREGCTTIGEAPPSADAQTKRGRHP